MIMEEILKKYKALAEKIRDFGIKNGFDSENHNRLKGEWLDYIVYFADSFTTCSVKLGIYEISFFSNKITIPVGVTEKKLEIEYEKSKKIIEKYISEFVKKTNEEIDKDKAERIEKLKKELEALEGGM